MCLIKSMTTAAMLIVFISRTAYADCDSKYRNTLHDLFKMFEGAHKNVRDLVADIDRNDTISKDLDSFREELDNPNDSNNCCEDFKLYESIHSLLNTGISALLAMYVNEEEEFRDVVDQFINARNIFHLALHEGNYWTTGRSVPFDSIQPNKNIKNYLNSHHNKLRNKLVFDALENPLGKHLDTLTSCTPNIQHKRIVGLLNVQPKMEARNAPLPAESAAGRWEDVDRENRAFHHQQQEPDRLDTPRESVDPLDDMVRQIRVYDKLQEIRKALKRSDKLLVQPVHNDDMREVRAYDQQARPGLVVKRNEFLTNTWVDYDTPDTYYVAAKRDAETLGPFDESGKRSGRLDSLDQALEFKRALEFLELY